MSEGSVALAPEKLGRPLPDYSMRGVLHQSEASEAGSCASVGRTRRGALSLPHGRHTNAIIIPRATARERAAMQCGARQAARVPARPPAPEAAPDERLQARQQKMERRELFPVRKKSFDLGF